MSLMQSELDKCKFHTHTQTVYVSVCAGQYNVQPVYALTYIPLTLQATGNSVLNPQCKHHPNFSSN